MAAADLTQDFLLRFYAEQIPEFIRKYLEASSPGQESLQEAYARLLQVMLQDCGRVLTSGPAHA